MRKQSKVLLADGILAALCALALPAVSCSTNRPAWVEPQRVPGSAPEHWPSVAGKRSPWLEAQRLSGSLPRASLSVADRARVLEIAREAAKAITIPSDSEPFIQESDTEYIVTFPVWYARITRGPDYHAQIVIEKASGKVLRRLVGC